MVPEFTHNPNFVVHRPDGTRFGASHSKQRALRVANRLGGWVTYHATN